MENTENMGNRRRHFHWSSQVLLTFVVCCPAPTVIGVEIKVPAVPARAEADGATTVDLTGESMSEKAVSSESTIVENLTGIDSEDAPSTDGSFKEYHENGELYRTGSYSEGKRCGEWKYFDSEGELLKSGSYKNGLIDGQWEFHDGTTKVRVESYRTGVPHGRWERYSTVSGKLAEVREFSDGKLHGVWQVYYPSGKLRESKQYEQGELHGEQKAWHANGTQASLGEYLRGKRQGTFSVWLQDGTLVRETKYENGRPVYK